MQLHQANQWTNQAQREMINLCGKLEMEIDSIKKVAREVSEKLKIQRISCEETDRARHYRIDELSMQ